MRSRNLFIETETFANIIDTTVERTSLLSFHFHVGVLLKCAVGQCVNFSLAPIKAPLISLYCCFSISFYSCGSLIVDLAVKFTSIVTEDWVLSVFRNATKSGTLGGFSVNASSIVGIAPVIQSTTKRPITTPTPEPDGMSPLHSSLKKKTSAIYKKRTCTYKHKRFDPLLLGRSAGELASILRQVKQT